MRETGPIRKRLSGPGADMYIGQARTLLGSLKERMVREGLRQLSDEYGVAGGVIIRVQSVFGIDSVSITVPTGRAFQSGEEQRQEYRRGIVAAGRYLNSIWRALLWTVEKPVQDLGPFGAQSAYTKFMSADGGVVVGENAQFFSLSQRVFRHTAATGMQDIGTLGGSYAEVFGVSASGGSIAGRSQTAGGQVHAYLWTVSGGMQDLGTLGGATSQGYAISADGLTVVGESTAGGGPQGFVYTAVGGMQGVGQLFPSYGTALAAVSADGVVAAGAAASPAGSTAIRWVAGAGMQNLGVLPGTLESTAMFVSADGSTIVGTCLVNQILQTTRVFRWTEADGMQDLGLSGVYSTPTGVSADGSVIVGTTGSAPNTVQQAFRWTPSGVATIGSGSSYSTASGVSADGTVVVGNRGASSAALNSPFYWTSVEGTKSLDHPPVALSQVVAVAASSSAFLRPI